VEDIDNTIVRSLSKIPLFFGLEPNELRVVLSLCEPVDYEQGDTIFNQDDPSHNMYILLSGSVYIVTERSGIIATLNPCDIFGEIGLITQRTRSASALAKTDCRLFRIDHVEFNFLAGKNPRISAILMRNISTNLANHVVRMNNAPLEHIPLKRSQKTPKEVESQVLIDEKK
jgi:CRP-like cAMP-binding protein